MTNDTRRGWGVNVTPRRLFTPGKDPVPIVQEAGWAPGPVWTGAENLTPTGIWSPHRPVRSQSKRSRNGVETESKRSRNGVETESKRTTKAPLIFPQLLQINTVILFVILLLLRMLLYSRTHVDQKNDTVPKRTNLNNCLKKK